MCSVGLKFLFPCLVVVSVVYGQNHHGSFSRHSDWKLKNERSYAGSKENIDGDFVFPTSNQLMFKDIHHHQDLKAEGTSWVQQIKNSWNDFTKGKIRKSDKKYFEYNSIIFPTDYKSNRIDETEEAEELDYNGRVLASPGEYPHMAAIGFQPAGQDHPSFRCGGSLISKMFVITAAHCTEFNGDAPNFVILGDVDLTRTDDPSSSNQNFQIKRIIVHPNYNKSSYYYDLALIELDRVIEFTEYVRPIRLWTHDEIPYETAYTMGYGSTEFGGRQTNKLTDLNMTILSNEQCNTVMPRSLETENGIIAEQVCAIDYQMNRDTCQGDSGGPLQINIVGRRRHRKHYFLIGIISYGIFCRSKNPSVYTRISSFVDWIENEVWPN